MTKETDYGKLLQAMYDQGFADCEAAAKLAIENGIKHAILAEREACAKLCESMGDNFLKDDEESRSAASFYCADEIRARGNYDTER